MGVAEGFGFFLRGLRMWRRRPALMLLGMVPAIVVLLLLLAAFVALLLLADDVIGWATPFADNWDDTWRQVLRVGLYIVVLITTLMLSVVMFTGLTLAIGDPFYEKIWKETERMLGGDVPDHGVGWVRGAVDGVALIGLGLVTTVGVFVVGLLPVIGTLLGAVLGVVVSGRLVADELVSRGLEARGMDRLARKVLLRGPGGAMFGFGVAVQLCFLVPLGAVLVMPAAVAGSTMLARAALDAREGRAVVRG
jgi:CysZ protein